ncbi:hypothetical protein CspHIS471_0212250 [Cutaneotrichosporon sp. HIS471]|nr:hypothetical protein CspHIS471_0212250 [Cutaneotrichosporon sp. HIS471]
MLGLGLDYPSSSDDSDRERKVSSSSPSATEKAPVEKPVPGPKRPRKLPSLPSTFDSASAAHNNPSAHQGRVRSRPFADGDYYAHVYVELDVSAPLRRTIDATLAEASSTCAGTFSLSLAGTPVVYYNTLGGPSQAAGRGKPTPGARAFLGLRVGAGAKELADLLGKQEDVLAKMHLPLYHAQPEFHASFGWALCPSPQEGGDNSPEATPFPVDLVARLAQHTDPVLAEHPGWHVGTLCVKVAKHVTRIQL